MKKKNWPEGAKSMCSVKIYSASEPFVVRL